MSKKRQNEVKAKQIFIRRSEKKTIGAQKACYDEGSY